MMLALAPAVRAKKSLYERAFKSDWFASEDASCECLTMTDPRWKCAPKGYLDAFDADVAREIVRDAESRGASAGWESERGESWRGLERTRQVRAAALSERTRRELRRVYEKSLIPLAREQCVLDDHLKFEQDEWFVVKYDEKEFPSTETHMDEAHVSFLVSLNNVTEYGGGGNTYEGLAFSIPHNGMHKLDNHDIDALPVGGVVVHGSRLSHRSRAVTSGVRYVLVGEVFVNQSCCWNMTAYLNKMATRVVILVFFFVFLFYGFFSALLRNIEKARNGGVDKQKVW